MILRYTFGVGTSYRGSGRSGGRVAALDLLTREDLLAQPSFAEVASAMHRRR